jgi:putative heme-binding domain-containing protein
MKRFWILWMLGVGFGHAQMANQPPVPQWLELGGALDTVEVRFEQKGVLLKAILLLAAESSAEVLVNERPMAKVGPMVGGIATSIDLTSLIKQGPNVLSITSASPRVAARLELNGDLAQVRWIPTDETWTSPKGKVAVVGRVDLDEAKNPFDLKKTFDAYNSWQLAKPGAQSQATDPSSFTLLPGFKVELLRSAQPGEDSWVSMAFDPEGRVTLAKEKKGLLRYDSKSGDMREIESSLLECRGLLYAHGVLYANANNSKGLYRLRDADGDGVFEWKEELMRSEGGVGHGRNHIKLGPDGDIYVAHGNNVLLPKNIDPESPLKNYANDQLIPNSWDSSMFDGNVELPAGHILRVRPDGSKITLLAGGLRNPLDIAFNRDGELFTFDADMERDVGAPWYMPTRVLHVVPGADFGWRRGTGRLPSWSMDTLPSVIDIGLASPTGIYFGYESSFPKKYREALYILDWSYGRIIAVHMSRSDSGTSYKAEQETFIAGRPLNVTDGCIGPDGAMWFITGGRGTQSGLYRVTSLKPEREPKRSGFARVSSGSRQVRDVLEERVPQISGMPKIEPKPNFDYAWRNLGIDDPFARLAARQWVQRTPVAQWRERALTEENKARAIVAMLELARVGTASDLNPILTKLLGLKLSSEELLSALRVIAVAISRHGVPGKEQLAGLSKLGEANYPLASNDVLAPELQINLNRELCRLLTYLKSPSVIDKTTPLLQAAMTSEDLLFYPFMLRYLKEGWTLEQRRIVFEVLNKAEKMNGASTFFKAISDTRSELAAALKPEELLKLADVIHPPKPVALSPHAMPGHTYRVWKIEDLEPRLAEVGKGRSFEKGKAAAIATQCVFCHTMSTDRSLPAGLFGPELVQVSARFGRRDLLDHILNPSKVIDEKFRFVTLKRADGSSVMGSLESEDDERVVLKPNPLSPETIEVGKSSIVERRVSEVSPMPQGLFNSLKAEQILDLLAFIEAGGDPKKANFQP